MIESVSRRAFGGSSGTYNVRASELARERKLNTITANVYFLDNTEHRFQIEKKAKGSILLDQVFQHLDLVEKDYFGLQFNEDGSPPGFVNNDLTRWLDSSKSVKKQAGGNPHLWFVVRFYPPEPSRLAEEYTRYQLCLQIRKLLLDGRLTAPKNTALLLASFMVQAELGDYSSSLGVGYLSGLRLLTRQNIDDERRVRELHRLHRGQLPADAEANFLEHAKRLDGYGVESHPAKDSTGRDILVGVTSVGLVVFQNSVRINTFSWGKIVKISFKRKQFFIQLKREPSESYDTVLGFNMRSSRAAKCLWRCAVEQHGFFRLRRPKVAGESGICSSSSASRIGAALAALSGSRAKIPRTESQALEDGWRAARMQRVFVRAPSLRNPSVPVSEESPAKVSTLSPGLGLSSGGAGRKVTTEVTHAPRAAWMQDSDDAAIASDEEGGFLERALRVPLGYADEDSPVEETDPPSPLRTQSPQAPLLPVHTGQDGLVTVRLYADSAGRYGFNVRGGLELEAPVVVSRVAPSTPAAKADPAIQEGDQLLAVNGVDVERMLHEQVIQLIRANKGALTLTLRPNAVYTREDECGAGYGSDSEPPVRFVPASPGNGANGGPLQQSLLLLGDGLASGAALKRYEALPRRDLTRPAAIARLPQNHTKNRYRDIAPYDSTRVILKNAPNGDYINASYINMEIPNSDLQLTYIASQGPLPSTVNDFWQMVLESGSSLVVMLTVLSERGRAKCHQYWPVVGQTLPLSGSNNLYQVETVSEEIHPSGDYIYRKMLLKHPSLPEPRSIHHLQYVSWPDHGVPEDCRAFLDFSQRCTALRDGKGCAGETPPMIVHCSAGVGRTGALILAETAIALIETGQPIYPLDLVKRMREQRPMCIQNVGQYKFVCESIQTAYNLGLAKPPLLDSNPF